MVDIFRKVPPSLFSCLQCSALGLHLNLLLDRSQQFQDVAESLRSWLQESEEAVTRLLLEPISSDPAILQRQLANAKVSEQAHSLLGFNADFLPVVSARKGWATPTRACIFICVWGGGLGKTFSQGEPQCNEAISWEWASFHSCLI